jgi:predicted transcriptional regulator
MDIQAEKIAVIKALEQTNDEALIKAIQEMIENAVKKDEEHLGTTLEEYNKELDEAYAEVKRGQFVEHSEALKQIRAWQKKEE